MILNYRKFLMLLSVFALLFVQACDNNDPEPAVPGAEGFYVVNEGGFGNGNTSISFFDEKTGQMSNDLFAAVNGRPLGDQAQSMAVFEGKGYIVVQGSAKIEVVDADDFKSITTISEDIKSPRYFLGLSATKAYVSDWGPDGVTGTIKVLDLSTNKVTKSIETGQGTNKMIRVGNKVYAVNAGGWGSDNTVKIIDVGTDAVSGTITVGDNPNSLVTDAAGNIWVTSGGYTAYDEAWNVDEENSTPASISKISSDNETLRIEAPDISYGSMSNLNVSSDGNTLYFIYSGGVYKMSTSATELPLAPFRDKSYYGLSINPFNGEIIGCVAPNFSSAGTIEVMDESGAVLNTYTVGIAPSGCTFK